MVKKLLSRQRDSEPEFFPLRRPVRKRCSTSLTKPAIQYIVEEAVRAGITDILIITNRGKGIIEDHFDHAVELEAALKAKGGREDVLKELGDIASMANIFFLRQKVTKGLGHAVLQARSFIGDDPFAVLYGDDVIIGEDPAIAQLCRAYDKYGKGVVGVNKVSPEAIGKYSSLKVDPLEDRIFKVTDMVEKPTPDKVLSLYSILGRCVLEPEIFDILERTPLGAGGELQLTDAMKTTAREKSMIAVEFTGKRYDMGNKLGIMQAGCEVALKHPEIGEDFKAYLKELVKTF